MLMLAVAAVVVLVRAQVDQLVHGVSGQLSRDSRKVLTAFLLVHFTLIDNDMVLQLLLLLLLLLAILMVVRRGVVVIRNAVEERGTLLASLSLLLLLLMKMMILMMLLLLLRVGQHR